MNLNETPIREKYKEFYGSYTLQMELLRKDNRIPMTMKDIIERRLNSKQKDWKSNYFNTCDAIIYGKEGKFKIVKNCDILKNVNSKTNLQSGRIKITEKEYAMIDSPEFRENDEEQVWKYLIQELYDGYVQMSGFLSAIYVSGHDEFLIRAWCVYWLDDNGRSDANGDGNLDDDDGRLVGLASEMQDLEEKSA